MKTLIIPDVHGRKFWKKAVRLIDSVDHIVFLGDYVDPYKWEGISKKDAIDNFKEIIDFAKEHENKVTLLYGNHCLHYVFDTFNRYASGGRIDTLNFLNIKQMYTDNSSLFKLAYELEDNGVKYLFSHAGVCKSWYELHKDLIGELNANNLNKLLDNDEGIKALCDIGYSRGGYEKDGGSMVWADINDHSSNYIEYFYQIFGHTQQESKEVICKHYACLDVRKCFLLENNEIKPID